MIKREVEDGYSSSKLPSADASVDVDRRSRRDIRSRYLAVKNMIHDEKEEIARPESDKFDSIFSEMESLHELVTKPREQVADAQALLDITKSLVAFAKAHAMGGVTPSEFVSHILEEFGEQSRLSASKEDCTRNSVAWKDIGLAVSQVFKACPGCYTMFGPLDTKMKQKPVVNRRTRKRVRPTELVRPEELYEGPSEERAETDKIMFTMFNILRKSKVVKLDNLILNRNSFAQTVENLFALSFLVKDGRAEIKVNEAGWQLVLPRNAPSKAAYAAGDVACSHFVFRFDFNDWKLMAHSVGVGEELMPHRDNQSQSVVVTGPFQQMDDNSDVKILPHRECQTDNLDIIEPFQQKDDGMEDFSAVRTLPHRECQTENLDIIGPFQQKDDMENNSTVTNSQSQSVVATGLFQQKSDMEDNSAIRNRPHRECQSQNVVVIEPFQQKDDLKDNSAIRNLPHRECQLECVDLIKPSQHNSAIRNQVSKQRDQELVRGAVQVASDPNNHVRKSSRQRRENSQLKEFVWGV